MENIPIYFLCFFIEAAILLQYASHLFMPRRTLVERLTLLVCLYLGLFIVSLFDIKWLNMGLYILGNFIFLYFQYTLSCHSAVFHSGILAAVMSMSELIVYSIIEHFTPHFFAKTEFFHNKLLFIILSKILFFSISYIQIHILKRQKGYMEHCDNSVLILISIPVTTIFAMLTLVNISDTCSLTSEQIWMVSFTALLLLATNLIVFAINQYNQEKYTKYTQIQLLLQKEMDSTEYYKMLLTQNENQKILLHDIKKHLRSIEILNEQGESRKISEYINHLMRSSNLKEASRICSHELLNAILARYQRQCYENQINFHADIRKKTTDFISDNDLTSLFCNLLDNAFEAAVDIHDSFIEISTAKGDNTPFVTIVMINSCRLNPFSKENGHLQTTKSNKHWHGLGIKSIRKIVQKYYGDMQMYYNDNTQTFHTILTLKQPMMP